jgi:hypothetical protein
MFEIFKASFSLVESRFIILKSIFLAKNQNYFRIKLNVIFLKLLSRTVILAFTLLLFTVFNSKYSPKN